MRMQFTTGISDSDQPNVNNGVLNSLALATTGGTVNALDPSINLASNLVFDPTNYYNRTTLVQGQVTINLNDGNGAPVSLANIIPTQANTPGNGQIPGFDYNTGALYISVTNSSGVPVFLAVASADEDTTGLPPGVPAIAPDTSRYSAVQHIYAVGDNRTSIELNAMDGLQAGTYSISVHYFSTYTSGMNPPAAIATSQLVVPNNGNVFGSADSVFDGNFSRTSPGGNRLVTISNIRLNLDRSLDGVVSDTANNSYYFEALFS